ncbi:M24 family metallopeptidase [Lacisediminihabitans sp. FW035]
MTTALNGGHSSTPGDSALSDHRQGRPADAGDDHETKRRRLLAILDDHRSDALVLTSPGALSWYLEGARIHVSLVGDPVLAVTVDREGDEIVAYSNEEARLVLEELPTGIPVRSVRWDASLLDPRFVAPSVLQESDAAAELRAARAMLLPGELARYTALCAEVAAMMTAVLREERPQNTERQVTARISQALVDLGAEPLVLLAAGRSRLEFRHPLATDSPIGDTAMVVACARRGGLIANLTRWVRFGRATAEQQDAQSRILEVEADYFRATVPGRRLSDAFAAGTASYATHGFAPDEWMRHHQGGPCGYNGRDPRATAETTDLIAVDQAFAWNPSAPGVKVEDTMLRTADGFRVLTTDAAWPTTTVAGLARPAVMEL